MPVRSTEIFLYSVATADLHLVQLHYNSTCCWYNMKILGRSNKSPYRESEQDLVIQSKPPSWLHLELDDLLQNIAIVFASYKPHTQCWYMPRSQIETQPTTALCSYVFVQEYYIKAHICLYFLHLVLPFVPHYHNAILLGPV